MNSDKPVDPSKQLFPNCIVWSPLPPITWLLPFIGHTGICDSEGIIYDFAGPYHIGKKHMAFGAPTRYIKLDPLHCTQRRWDEGVEEGNAIYSRRMHNIFCDNCHSHVAQCLNLMGYKNKNTYTMVTIGVWFFFCGKWVSTAAFIRTYMPFAIVVAIFIILGSTGVFG